MWHKRSTCDVSVVRFDLFSTSKQMKIQGGIRNEVALRNSYPEHYNCVRAKDRLTSQVLPLREAVNDFERSLRRTILHRKREAELEKSNVEGGPAARKQKVKWATG